jgi:hypothetical protein
MKVTGLGDRMRRLHRWAGVALVALALGHPGAAWADGWTISSPLETTLAAGTDASSLNRFYLTPEAGWLKQDLPNFHIGAVSPTNPQPFYSTGLSVDGAQGGLTIGYLLPSDPLGGRNSRVELSGNFYSLTGGASQTFGSVQPGYWTLVGGGAPLDTEGVYSTSVRSSMNGGEFAVRGAVDYPVTANFTVTPGVAVFGGWSRLEVDYSDTEACFGSECFVDTQNHRVRTAEVGGGISVGSRLTITPVMSVLFGGGVAVAYQDSQLSSADCFDENDTQAGCQSTSPETSSTARASHVGVGYRVMGQTGVRYLIGPAELNLLGSVRYAPVPTINNPTSGSQMVSLSSTQQLGYAFTVSVRIPFGGWATR